MPPPQQLPHSALLSGARRSRLCSTILPACSIFCKVCVVGTRSRPPLDLAWNPLVLVLGQVVTSAVLKIEGYVPELQERLRRNGYPRFNRVETQGIRIGPGESVELQRETRWIFSTKDSHASVVVGANVIVLQVSKYTSFEEFAERLSTVLTMYQDIVAVELRQRLGFRRINLLEGCRDLPIEKIVIPGFGGILGDIYTDGHEQRVEHWGRTESGRLMVRYLRPSPPTIVPPDIDTTGLSTRASRTSGRDSATLDIDHFVIGTGDFDPPAIVEDFWSLHDGSDSAFREAVTPHAISIWEQGDPLT